jgi:predicted HD superfamily hydrolase involved in NAD metabolism
MLDVPPLGISSTDVRRRVRAGAPVTGLVPRPVERLVRDLGLYRREGPAGGSPAGFTVLRANGGLMTVQEAQEYLRTRVSARLFEHSRHVAVYAVELARRWGASTEEAELAGWLHDSCKEMSGDELLKAAGRLGVPVDPIERLRPVQLLHAPVAAAELAALGLPAACCQAVRRHTVGGPGMSVLDQCLYIADAGDATREYEGVDELRRLARESLPAAVAWSAERTITRLIQKGRPIHPDTVAAYNEWHT